MTVYDILEKALLKSRKINISKIDINIIRNIDILINNINKNKSLVSALVTSLSKKIIEPGQDIRYHRTDFVNGYSARSLDTKFTTPFFKKYFPKYSNKESAFLTLSTRERIPWTMDEGKNLKVRNQELKDAFLGILHDVQFKNINPNIYLEYILYKLTELSENDVKIFDILPDSLKKIGVLNINSILKMFIQHFTLKHSSRLPVIAIYTVYQELFKTVSLYNDKILLPLNVHTSSDKHSLGDIEIYTYDNKPYEIIEIKHNKPIDRYLIFDIIKKSENKNISKYYLRFITDYHGFISQYSQSLIADAKYSTEVKINHIKEWYSILNQISINYK